MTTELQEEIETAFIGCLLMDFHQTLAETEDLAITPEMFLSGRARAAFEAAHALAKDNAPVDPLTLRDKIGPGGDPALTAFLTAAIDTSPSAAHAAYYGQLLRQKHEARKLRAILAAASLRLDDEPADMVQTDLLRILERNDPDPGTTAVTMPVATDAAVTMFRRAAEGLGGIRTGFAFIDAAGGLPEGAIIIVSGKAGSCKTTLARNILQHVCGEEKIPAALITLEMSETQIAAQTLTHLSETSFRKFMAGAADARDWTRLLLAKARAEGWPLGMTSRARTPARLSAFVRTAVRRGARVIVLDYLQALQPDPGQARSNIEQQVTHASATVRELAATLNVTFIVVSTESRDGELRYSDAIRYDAWLWLQMSQPEENNEDNPLYHCMIKKNRFGMMPKNPRSLYRVGDRLLTAAEWIEHGKANKGQRE